MMYAAKKVRAQEGKVHIHVHPQYLTPQDAIAFAMEILSATDNAKAWAEQQARIRKWGKQLIIDCLHCENEWPTQAKPGNCVNCPQCKKVRRIPTR